MLVHKSHFNKQEYGAESFCLRNIQNFKYLMKYFTVAWGDSKKTNLNDFIQCQYTRTISRNKNVMQSVFTKHSQFLIFNKIFHCDMVRWGKNNRKFLENIFTQKLL